MAMLELDHNWTIAAGVSSVAVTTMAKLAMPPIYSVLYCQSSTLASTQSFALQTAMSSAGPWFTEASTSVSATASATGCDALRLTGPYLFARPKLNTLTSTGAYQFRLIGVG